MTNQNKLEQLQSKLSTLKNDFKEQAVYSDEHLQRLIKSVTDYYNPNQEFYFEASFLLVDLLQNKFPEGWSFDVKNNYINISLNGGGMISLRKPQHQIDDELKDIEHKSKAEYLNNIEAVKPKIIAEIAEVKLQIRDTEAAIVAEAKRAKDFTKEVEKAEQELAQELLSVERELLGSAASTKDNSE